MKLRCPVCGEALEVDVDLVEGQRVSCDACDSSFIFRKEYALVGGRRSRQSPAECQRSKQRNHKKTGCLAQLSLLVFRVVLVVGLIIAAVKMLDVLFSSGAVRQVTEAFGDKANSPNVMSAKPQAVAAPISAQEKQDMANRNAEPIGNVRNNKSARDNELGLIWNERGQVVGAMGHRLGENEAQMDFSGWGSEKGLFGKVYVARLSDRAMNFSKLSLEYGKPVSRLWMISLRASVGAHRSRAEVQSFLTQIRDKISTEYGIRLPLFERGGEVTDSVSGNMVYQFDSYILEQKAAVKGCSCCLMLTAYEFRDGKYEIQFTIGCGELAAR